MASDIPITDAQFARALSRLTQMSPAERESERTRLGASGGRSYFVQTPQGDVSLKLVIRAAYADAKIDWSPGRGPQSRDVYDRFKHAFSLIYRRTADSVMAIDAEEQAQREFEYVKRLRRDGQAQFRQALLDRSPQCRVTGCRVPDALEAAHVDPAAAGGSFSHSNGFLLRADIHRLFDLGFIAFNPSTGRIWLHQSCEYEYRSLLDIYLDYDELRTRRVALEQRWNERVRSPA